MKLLSWLCTKSVLFLLIGGLLPQDTYGLGTNSEIEENELGTTSRACATNFCTEKDSLELWLSLEWTCHAPDEVQDEYSIRRRRRRLTTSKVMETITISRFMTGLVCAVLGGVGYILGFLYGSNKLSSCAISTNVLSDNFGGPFGRGGTKPRPGTAGRTIKFAYAEIPESDLDIGVDAEARFDHTGSEEDEGESSSSSNSDVRVLRAIPVVARNLSSGKYIV